MPMADTWILVADHARARLFSMDTRTGRLDEIKSFVNVTARQRTLENERAPLPRTQVWFGASRHAIEPRTTPRDKLAMQFARILEATLHKGYVDHHYERLVLVAPPRFLRIVTTTLNTRLRDRIAASVAKNLTRRSTATIRAHLPQWLTRRGVRSSPMTGRL